MSKTSNKLPDVLSFQRGTIISDGTFFSVSGEHLEPVRVIRHGIRGITAKESANHVSNPQRTESAKTSTRATGLSVQFVYRTIPAQSLLFGCSVPDYRDAVAGFVDRFFVRGVPEFDEVCRRYARNILNGRWLWRNRMLGEVSVTVKSVEKTYQSKGSRLRDFEDYTPDEISLASDVIAAGLLTGGIAPTAHVEGRVDFGFAGEIEVFPSQNMVTNKPKGFARSLYKVNMISRKALEKIISSGAQDGENAGEFAADMIDMGQAALRDQKIGNAIRTIDTWYDEGAAFPIPVEPNGGCLETNQFYRKNKSDAKALLPKLDELEPCSAFNPEAAFLIALMIRGGVFSEGNGKKEA